jgi:hypothetical protein
MEGGAEAYLKSEANDVTVRPFRERVREGEFNGIGNPDDVELGLKQSRRQRRGGREQRRAGGREGNG